MQDHEFTREEDYEFPTEPDVDVEAQLLTELVRMDPKEVRRMGAAMSVEEARHVVNDYYRIQEQRIRTASQIRTAPEGDAMEITRHLNDQAHADENTRRLALLAYAQAHPVGRWSMAVKGIGPVIAAGLLAHIDVRKATNVGKLWRFAGLDPTLDKPKRGSKRQYNAKLKRLSWLIGESFTRVSGREDAVYGKIYRARKDQEISRNEAGMFAAQAEHTLATVNLGTDTEAHKWYIAREVAAGADSPAGPAVRGQVVPEPLALRGLRGGLWYPAGASLHPHQTGARPTLHHASELADGGDGERAALGRGSRRRIT